MDILASLVRLAVVHPIIFVLSLIKDTIETTRYFAKGGH